jgi:hypothetical protein
MGRKRILPLLCLLAALPVCADSSESATFTVDTRIVRIDTDQDGLPDAYEQAVGLNPRVADADQDPDHDGFTNLEEYSRGTDPLTKDSSAIAATTSALFTLNTEGFPFSPNLDTDHDGMPDWWEIRHRLNPLVADGGGDADLDGRSNLSEFLNGLDPNTDERATRFLALSPPFEVDTGGRFLDIDADGLPNWWERIYFDTSTGATRSGDPDGDGHRNYDEFLAGTDPRDPNSVLKLLDLRLGFGTAILRWSSERGRAYSLWTADKAQGSFATVATNIAATPPINSFTNPASSAIGFYRVTLLP